MSIKPFRTRLRSPFRTRKGVGGYAGLHYIFLSFLLTNCSSISIMHFSGAEGLEKGRAEVIVAASYAPNLLGLLRDSSHAPNRTFDPLFEARGRIGVSDRFEIGLGVWTSDFPLSTIAAGAADLGGRFDVRYCLTPRRATHRMALLGTFSGYYVINTFTGFDEFERSYGGTWGGGGGIVYEMIIDPGPGVSRLDSYDSTNHYETGIYTGAMLRYLHNDYTYGLAASESSTGVEEIRAKISHNAPFLSPFVGLRLPGPVCIEICGLLVRPPAGDAPVWGVFGGVSFGKR